MSKAVLGSFNGPVTPGINMVDVFRQRELAANPNSTLRFSDMMLKKLGIQTEAGTMVAINGSTIPIVSGIFELGFGQLDVTSLIFPTGVEADIYYMY